MGLIIILAIVGVIIYFLTKKQKHGTIKEWGNTNIPSKRDKTTALILSIFFGWLGVDCFYLGHTLYGVFKLLTLGFFGLIWIRDIFEIYKDELVPIDVEEASYVECQYPPCKRKYDQYVQTKKFGAPDGYCSRECARKDREKSLIN